jgi:hypothetical protein
LRFGAIPRQQGLPALYDHGDCESARFVVVAGAKGLLKDSDTDDLLDAAEKRLGTDPHSPDTDGDVIGDGNEVDRYGTNPLYLDIVVRTTMLLTATYTKTVTERTITFSLSAPSVGLVVIASAGIPSVVLLNIWKRRSCSAVT